MTYLRNVIPHLAGRTDVQATILLSSDLRAEFRDVENVAVLEVGGSGGSFLRAYREQTLLPRLIRQSGADVLISAGNFALRNSPVPQILLSRNSLYTSSDFVADLRARREFGLWLDTRIKARLARQSIQWADCTVAPSHAFAEELRAWTGRNVVALHHGFDRQAFLGDPTPLPQRIQREVNASEGCFRLLFVSHYNYYRNFEMLLRAVPLIRQGMGNRRVKLFLTCKLSSQESPGNYRAEAAARLVKDLALDDVIQLGAIPYRSLHHLYGACDAYVTAAYAESFAHPLVEAMASGLPIVASDIPVHREICDGAALYFRRFSPEELADRVVKLVSAESLAQRLAERGLQRSSDFSWRMHVQTLVDLAGSLIGQLPKTALASAS